jgi:RNA polymerase sigma-70 factor (ECF subfamily)
MWLHMNESGAMRFNTTHWSVVRRAAGTQNEAATQALGVLCETYWPPVYAYLRRHGRSPHEAEDLTQDFFAQMLENQSLTRADAQRGKFRTFLLACLNRFLGHAQEQSQAMKRGGHVTFVHLDVEGSEQKLALESPPDTPPERAFDKQWALTLLDHTMALLREEFVRAGRADRFEVLCSCLSPEGSSESCAGLAAKLDMKEGAVKVAIHRLRNRYREILRAEVAKTVDGEEEIDEEVRHLLAALAD